MAIINKVTKLSKLSTLGKVLDEVKTILAYNKKNYQIPVTKIQGTKFAPFSYSVSTEDGGRNIFYINYSDGDFDTIVTFNGSQGDKGKKGYKGEKGDKGEAGDISDLYGSVTGVITIVNDVEDGAKSTDALSALRGKKINDELKTIDETFCEQSDYENLFVEKSMVWLNCTFESTTDDEEVKLWNNDTNDHNVYTKWWTYEDTGSETYYIKVTYKGYKQITSLSEIPSGATEIYIPKTDDEGKETGLGYDPISIPAELSETSKYYIYTDIERYDATNADLWSDVYEGAKTGYFEATTNQLTDSTQNYIYDESTNTYIPIDKDSYGNKSFKYYVKDLLEYVNVEYDAQTKNYEFTLNAQEIPIVLYSYDPETDTYTLVEDLDVIRNREDNDITAYYSEENQESVISSTNLDAYITRNSVRWYKLSDGKYIEIQPYYDEDNEVYDYDVVPSEIDVNNYQEYIRFEKDTINKQYIFDYHYTTTYKDEHTWQEKKVILTNSSITIYVYDTDRKYYKVIYTTTLDKNNQKVTSAAYQEIATVSWIKATFTTTSEDEETRLLNSYTELGVEDNSSVDVTEDVVSVKEVVPIQFIIVGTKEDIYKKSSISDTYNIVDIYNDTLLSSSVYYTKTVNTSYEKIDSKDNIKGSIIYTSNDEVNFTAVTIPDELDETVKYYNKIDTEIYTEIPNLSTFLSEGEVTIFNGEPTNVHITSIPSNTTYKEFNMEYDNSLIKLYEDGRIASLEENGTTDIKLTSVDNPNITAKLTVTLVTPSKKLTIENKTAKTINIGQEAEFIGTITPDNPSNKNIIWSVSDTTVATIEEVKTGDNVTGCKVKGIEQGIINVKGVCADNFSGETSQKLEVIQPVESVTITDDYKKHVETILTNKKYKIEVDIQPLSSTYPTINWTSDIKGITFTKEKVDEVKHNYVTTPIYDYYFEVKEAGDYIITGTTTDGSNITVTFNIHANTSVTEINISPSVLSMNITTVKQLSIEVIPSNAFNGQYEWSSANTEIATITSDGIVTAGTIPGTTVITATAKDGSGTVGICNLTTTVPVTNIDLSVSTSYVGIGQSIKVKSELYPATADLQECVWSTSDTSIATVDQTGNVTGKSIGKVTIVAAAKDGSGVIGTCKVEVIQLAQSLSFGFEELNVTLSDTVVLLPKFNPDNTSIEKLIWLSSDETIAQVNTSGSLTLLKTGEVKISATTTDGTNLTAECTIKIN